MYSITGYGMWKNCGLSGTVKIIVSHQQFRIGSALPKANILCFLFIGYDNAEGILRDHRYTPDEG